AVGRSHEGIRPGGQIEHGAVRAFPQERPSAPEVIAKIAPGVADVGSEALRGAPQSGRHLGNRRNLRAPERAEKGLHLRCQTLDTTLERARSKEVGDSNPLARRRRLVSRTNPAERGAELLVARRLLAGAVQEPVIRKNDLSALGEKEVLPHLDSLRPD